MRFDNNLALRVGNQVRQLRSQAFMTQEDLAGETGLHTNYISLIERGKRGLTIEAAIKICNALGIKVSQLLANIGE